MLDKRNQELTEAQELSDKLHGQSSSFHKTVQNVKRKKKHPWRYKFQAFLVEMGKLCSKGANKEEDIDGIVKQITKDKPRTESCN